MARKSKYTPETVKKITEAIRLGSTYRLACAYAGISEDTFAAWRTRYPDFSDAIKEAEGRGAATWLLRIEEAAKTQWQAAAWKLERRYPEEYGRQIHDHRVTIEDEARRIAREMGLDEDAVVAEAVGIVREVQK